MDFLSRLKLIPKALHLSLLRGRTWFGRTLSDLIRGDEQGGGPLVRETNLFAQPPNKRRQLTRSGLPASSTADYYHLDGILWWRPYDLQKDFGPHGMMISERNRSRYVWILGPDDADEVTGWGGDAGSIYIGFTNDPAILPSPLGLIKILPFTVEAPNGETYDGLQVPWLVYNPDDAAKPFYLYIEGHWKKNVRKEGLLFRSDDLVNWTMHGVSHATQSGNASYQTVYRLGTGNWISYGLAGRPEHLQSRTVWISSDGLTFQLSHSINTVFNKRNFSVGEGAPIVIIGGQRYAICREDARSADGGQYVSRIPIDDQGNIVTSNPDLIVRLSRKYGGMYPGPSYLNSVSGYCEDGVYHIWAVRGFFSSAGQRGDGASYRMGGGLGEQYIDYYSFVYDEKQARQAAPSGVRGTCDGGMTRLHWHASMPNKAYKVYRAGAETGPWTLINVCVGIECFDTAPTGQRWYYKIATLDKDRDCGSRIVTVYASHWSALVNNHVDRVLSDGASLAGIDVTWLHKVDTWLRAAKLTSNLLFWTNPAFGYSGSDQTVSKVYDLGATRLPRGGDYTPYTRDTVYEAKGINGTIPAVVNRNSSAFGYYGAGRLNNIRRKSQITVVAAYEKLDSGSASLLSYGLQGGFSLRDTGGAQPHVTFTVTYPVLSQAIFPVRRVRDLLLRVVGATRVRVVSASKSLGPSPVRVIAGNFDGTTLRAYADGVGGSWRVGSVRDTTVLSGQALDRSFEPVLGVGATKVGYSSAYVFDGAQARFAFSDLIVFDKALTARQIRSLTRLLSGRINASP